MLILKGIIWKDGSARDLLSGAAVVGVLAESPVAWCVAQSSGGGGGISAETGYGGPGVVFFLFLVAELLCLILWASLQEICELLNVLFIC